MHFYGFSISPRCCPLNGRSFLDSAQTHYTTTLKNDLLHRSVASSWPKVGSINFMFIHLHPGMVRKLQSKHAAKECHPLRWYNEHMLHRMKEVMLKQIPVLLILQLLHVLCTTWMWCMWMWMWTAATIVCVCAQNFLIVLSVTVMYLDLPRLSTVRIIMQ